MGGHVDKLAVARVNLLMAVEVRQFQVGRRQRFLHFGAISHKQRQVGPNCRINDSRTVTQSRKVSPERSFRDEKTALYQPLYPYMTVIAIYRDVNEALKLVTEMV